MRKEKKQAAYLVPALERGLNILELLSRHPRGLQMGEMQELQLPPASLYRLLTTLVELGYVIRGDGDRYRLGRKLLTLGYRSIDASSLVEKALPVMRELRNRTGETVMLGVLYGAEGVVVESVKSDQAVCVSGADRTPLSAPHGGAGQGDARLSSGPGTGGTSGEDPVYEVHGSHHHQRAGVRAGTCGSPPYRDRLRSRRGTARTALCGSAHSRRQIVSGRRNLDRRSGVPARPETLANAALW